MHILFIDESGSTPDKNKAKDTYFVLGGIAIAEQSWKTLSNSLDSIKRKYDVSGEVKWRYFSPHNQNQNNTLRHLDFAARSQIRQEMFSALIGVGTGARAIACIAHIQHAYTKPSVKDRHSLYAQIFSEICARFQFLLQEKNDSGVVVCDHRQGPEDTHLRDFHFDLIKNGGVHNVNYRNFVEGLFLAPSHHSVGVQYADLIAGSVFRYAEKGDDTFIKALRPVFKQSPEGRIEGYGIVRFAKTTWPADAITIPF